MVTVKEAVKNSVNFLNEMDESLLNGDFLVEEVEKTENEDYWLITLSFLSEKKTGKIKFSILAERKYKIFKVKTLNGEVVSMKIRELEYA
jgi:hypothetical protein